MVSQKKTKKVNKVSNKLVVNNKNKKRVSKKYNKKSNNKSSVNNKNFKRNIKKKIKHKKGGGEDEKLRERVKELKNDLMMEKNMNARIKRDLDKILPSMKDLREKIVYQYNSFNELNEVIGKIFGKKEI